MTFLDPRLRWLLRGQMWPKLWRDLHFLKCSDVGERTRLDVIGTSGLGKTYFTKKLAAKLGARSPEATADTKHSSEWADFFDLALTIIGQQFSSPGLAWHKKVDKTILLANRFELERKTLHRPSGAIAVNNESVLRHHWVMMADLASTRPEFVKDLLGDRLCLVCDANDPVELILERRKQRGDETIDDLELRGKLDKQVLKIRQGADVLSALGIPVQTINLDDPTSENIAVVAKFLDENHATSPRIKRWAKRVR